MTAPSILLVDDGELDPVQAMLERLRVDWVRCRGPEAGALQRPRDLLITSGPRALAMPPMMGDESPVWLCLYDAEFIPIRERLCAEGVHYLVPGDLEPRTLALFIRQLLHRDDERRCVRRIPMQCEIEVHLGFERRKGQLLELSRESCVFATDVEVPPKRRVRLRLPSDLTGDGELDLDGHVVRTSGAARSDRECNIVTVFRFAELGADAMGVIHSLLAGDTPVAEVTPLQAEPVASEDDASDREPGGLVSSEGWQPQRGERRSAPRRAYSGSVDAISWQGDDEPRLVMGRELSESGVRIGGAPPLEMGQQLALLLYGAPREEPVLVDAVVVRIDGDEAGLHFPEVNPAQRRGLQHLLAMSPPLEALVDQGGAVYVAQMLDG